MQEYATRKLRLVLTKERLLISMNTVYYQFINYVVKISNLIHVFQLCFQNKVARFTRIGMKYKNKIFSTA